MKLRYNRLHWAMLSGIYQRGVDVGLLAEDEVTLMTSYGGGREEWPGLC